MDFKTAFFAAFVCWPIAIGTIIAIFIHLVRRIRRLELMTWEDEFRLVCSRKIAGLQMYPRLFGEMIAPQDFLVRDLPRKIRYDPPWKPHQLTALGLHLRRATRGRGDK